MTTLTYQVKRDFPDEKTFEQVRDDAFSVPGVTGAGSDGDGSFFVLVEDDAELDREELARFFGYADYADFLAQAGPTIINETDSDLDRYEVGRITSLVDITPDEDD